MRQGRFEGESYNDCNHCFPFSTLQVLHEGRLVEFDEPYELLQKKSSKFSELVQEVGGVGSEKLLEMARKAHHRRLTEDDSQHFHSSSERNSEDKGKDTPNGLTDNHTANKNNSAVADHFITQ